MLATTEALAFQRSARRAKHEVTEEFDCLLRRKPHSSPLRGAKSSSVYRGNLVQASEWMLAYTRNEHSQVSPQAMGPLAVEESAKRRANYFPFNYLRLILSKTPIKELRVLLFRQRGAVTK